MRYATAIGLLFLGIGIGAQERIRVGGGRGDALKDWPRPEVRDGLTPDQIGAAIGDYGEMLAAQDRFSGVVLVLKDGQTLLSRAWGMADGTEKNTLDTKFNIGSINKSFTKKAIEQLAHAGKLSFDDTVRQHLPDYPSAVADRITIRQLLNHRSGLGDIFGPKYNAAPPSRLRELSDFLTLFVDEPLQFEPNASQRYSNAGYIVLGLIVERLSGLTYRDYVRTHIFEPAGMKNTGFWAVDEAVPHRATGYTARGPGATGGRRVPNTASLPGRPSSAGGAYATAGDLLRFFQWLGVTGIGVGGGAPGLNAAVEIAEGWTVIAMSNYDPPAAQALASGAMDIALSRTDGRKRRPPAGPEQPTLGGAPALDRATVAASHDAEKAPDLRGRPPRQSQPGRS